MSYIPSQHSNYCEKLHWARFTLRPTTWNWSVCGKRIPFSALAATIPEITCKTCKRRAAQPKESDDA